ncbi:MAG TPA: hypothetical protein VHI32_12245 [Burkholderiales bacterium]|jgi:hypothetical protein|nr:hypothetical protein [Burkholderiales bacterium]
MKIANRITSGVILAALIVGASLMMGIQTSWTLFGYPASPSSASSARRRAASTSSSASSSRTSAVNTKRAIPASIELTAWLKAES